MKFDYFLLFQHSDIQMYLINNSHSYYKMAFKRRTDIFRLILQISASGFENKNKFLLILFYISIEKNQNLTVIPGPINQKSVFAEIKYPPPK